jgi:hypothetical protein
VATATHTVMPFEDLREKAWPYRYNVHLRVGTLAGGVPSDPNVAEGWLRTKLGDSDEQIRELVATTMAERGMSLEEATAEVNRLKHLNGFKREESQGLYIEGRQIKAMLKEACSIAVASGKMAQRGWGKTNKGLLSFVAEHVFVPDERVFIHLEDESGNLVNAKEATGVNQKFVHTYRGAGIQYEEYVEGAHLQFVVMADYQFTREDWGMMWLTAEQEGLGASRSQGYGRFKILGWDLLD